MENNNEKTDALKELNNKIKPYKEIIWLAGLIIIAAYILIDYNTTCKAAIEGYNYAEAKYQISKEIEQLKAQNNGKLIINVAQLRQEALSNPFSDIKTCQIENEKVRYSLKMCIKKVCELEEDCFTEDQVKEFQDEWREVQNASIPVPIVESPALNITNASSG